MKIFLLADVTHATPKKELITPRGYHALITVYKKQSKDDFIRIDFDTNHRDRQDNGICLIGHYTKSFPVYSQGAFGIIYTVFEPAGAIAFFGHGQREFTDACVPLSEFNNDVAEISILEKLWFAHTDRQRVGVMEEMLLSLLKKRSNLGLGKFEHVADWIIQHNGCMTVDAIADQCGMSKRTLERKFVDVHGVTPKQYTKIVRFRSVMQYLLTQQHMPDWHELLHRVSYYDQAHFIHDFKEFTGKTPLAFFDLDRRFDNTFVAALK